MATTRGSVINTYDLTVGVIVDMDEAIYMVSPTDSPFLTGVDSDGLSILSSVPTNEKKVEWMHDGILTPRSTVGISQTTAATTLQVATGDGYKFTEGDLVDVDGEIQYITTITTDIATVTRSGDFGTSVIHAVGHGIIGIGSMLREGATPPQSRATDRTQFYNVTQIFGPEAVSMSRTEQVVAKYGVPNEMNHQLFQRTQELTIRREQAILYGKRLEIDATDQRAMGGIFYFVSTNHDTATTTLDVTAISSMQQTCWDAGGMPDRLATNPKCLSDLNSLADTGRVRVDFEDTRRGRAPLMSVITEFGQLLVCRNRWMQTNPTGLTNRADALLFKRDQVVRRPLRPLVVERLAKTGDFDSLQMVCEESLEVKGQQHMAKWTGLNY